MTLAANESFIIRMAGESQHRGDGRLSALLRRASHRYEAGRYEAWNYEAHRSSIVSDKRVQKFIRKHYAK